MGKHDYTKFDRARDELMSHVIRCDVLEAELEHREEWLAETMEYMAERYPMLSDLEMTKLEMVGKQFIKPPIPHGRGNTAKSRDANIDELVEDEITEEAEVTEVTGTPVAGEPDQPAEAEAGEEGEASTPEEAEEPAAETEPAAESSDDETELAAV